MEDRRTVDEGDEEALLARAEADLARWLAIEPSPAFKAGVRRRIAEAPPSAARPLRWPWLAGAVAGAALVIAIATRPDAPGRPAPTAITPGAVTSRSVPRAGLVPARAARAPAGRLRRARPASEAAVIVPSGEARRIEDYHTAVMHVHLSSLPAPAEELTITPLEIEPLPGSAGSAPPASGGDEPTSEEDI